MTVNLANNSPLKKAASLTNLSPNHLWQFITSINTHQQRLLLYSCKIKRLSAQSNSPVHESRVSLFDTLFYGFALRASVEKKTGTRNPILIRQQQMPVLLYVPYKEMKVLGGTHDEHKGHVPGTRLGGYEKSKNSLRIHYGAHLNYISMHFTT